MPESSTKSIIFQFGKQYLPNPMSRMKTKKGKQYLPNSVRLRLLRNRNHCVRFSIYRQATKTITWRLTNCTHLTSVGRIIWS